MGALATVRVAALSATVRSQGFTESSLWNFYRARNVVQWQRPSSTQSDEIMIWAVPPRRPRVVLAEDDAVFSLHDQLDHTEAMRGCRRSCQRGGRRRAPHGAGFQSF